MALAAKFTPVHSNPCSYCIAIMVDTEGSEIHTGELKEPIKTEVRSSQRNVHDWGDLLGS